MGGAFRLGTEDWAVLFYSNKRSLCSEEFSYESHPSTITAARLAFDKQLQQAGAFIAKVFLRFKLINYV